MTGTSRMHPLISVVVPSYNQGRWLDACLQSLLEQGDPNLEVIVMDGGSTDESRSVLERWAPRLAHWQSQKDGGQADAIASGFERARGAYLAWLNSDDMHMPWTLASWRAAFARDPQLEMLHADRAVIDGDGRIIGFRSIPFHSRVCLNRWPWTHQETAVWTRALYDRVGGVDRSFSFAMDYDLFSRFFTQGRCAHLRAMLGAFRWHDTSKSFTLQQSTGAREIARVREKLGIPRKKIEYPFSYAMSLAVRGVSRLHARIEVPAAHRNGRSARLAAGAQIGELWSAPGEARG